ncbi:NifB/NifX family molybdenum-iron cluster-binding protein [Caldicoprobacter algeriensis]|uniref:NifB/NifX family molybdenum-iron cluster-binding protein n=1 Tax=Caldicoprobacter algeriensis TaxID=699281 RepID=UPI0020792871|nr:NifB/NifX family molybdenum-iron cluster-binding protein [Caldicoprobacter algeriensis]MCM8900251.1 NifB/NifX family molybdenum-iron cluster-binding protein [Caldicoprobacter algeriensis]
MKVCVTATGNSVESPLDPRFGRAAFFVLVDTDSMEFECIRNDAAFTGGGAGVTASQLMVDKGVDAVVTGNIGPNAMNVLKAVGIGVYRGVNGSVKENVERLKKGLLDKIEDSVPPHYGKGFGWRQV